MGRVVDTKPFATPTTAGVVVAKLGTASVTPAELQHAVAADTSTTLGKPLGNRWRSLVNYVQRCSCHDQRVFRSNPSGAYSLSATGVGIGDVVVVAVNDDDSVKRLKGPSNP